ncbi:DUF2834 domain-containing protein [Ketobacter sp. MCCC 1A13808]|mgnify:CR=1 FL=1|uniref:DUF2834 domain-containing protein n=1 Tax=Ketobacter sp. MCCC 1A13808 TaxID=2602738 RepID=UPI000F1511A1|nr:DUF2834 domain-containing protein [Ketobacter sp. MCCC 1A13808]MVF11903.1 DUF2834 domain-containing protein [Ketobacter sp. MCCC 1A13808]RLP53084.1 MAG: DUF2834 domain-containing protein [Ketobacter sp.]
MKLKKVMLWLLLADMVLFSGYVMWEVGYMGIWQAGFSSLGSMQILLDLVICCIILASWMVMDARKRGVNPWPWIAATVPLGSIVPLIYLIVRESAKETYTEQIAPSMT